MSESPIPEFRVFPGSAVRAVLDADPAAVIAAVEGAYREHHEGRTTNPDSYFLRFPDRDRDRIIALPAHYGPDGSAVTGIKWISSFPGNVDRGIARASAVLILNDELTGYPIACMEAGSISATRTAASAMLGLRRLNGSDPTPKTVTVVGTGVISDRVLDFLPHAGIQVRDIVLFDAKPEYAESFGERIRARTDLPVSVAPTMEDALRAGQVILFATTAGTPHVHDPALFEHHPIVVHLSLRDLDPDIILASHNVVDDVDHCLKAQTSLHLAELQSGNRDFVRYTLPGILCGQDIPDRDRPIIFSPFGMGILDLALGNLVYSALVGQTRPVPDFYQGAVRF